MTIFEPAIPEMLDRMLLVWLCWYLVACAASIPLLIAHAITGKWWL